MKNQSDYTYEIIVIQNKRITWIEYNVTLNGKLQLGNLLEGVKEKRKEEEFTSTCALLVCNKWDQVKETKEEKKAENHVIEKLKKFYPHIVPEKQIVQMSTKNARIAQNYGIITKRFFSLMNCMRSMVLRSVKARLEFYWR